MLYECSVVLSVCCLILLGQTRVGDYADFLRSSQKLAKVRHFLVSLTIVKPGTLQVRNSGLLYCTKQHYYRQYTS